MKKITISLIVFFTLNTFSQSSKSNFWQNNNKLKLNNKAVTHNNYALDYTIKLEDADIPPIYKGCEDKISNNEKINCFITKLSIDARSTFIDSGILQKNKIKSSTNRLRILFVVDEKGYIKVKKIFGKNSDVLSEEMKKAVESAPILSPAKLAGKITPVKFSIKIPFIV